MLRVSSKVLPQQEKILFFRAAEMTCAPPPCLTSVSGHKAMLRGRAGGYREAPTAGILYTPSFIRDFAKGVAGTASLTIFSVFFRVLPFFLSVFFRFHFFPLSAVFFGFRFLPFFRLLPTSSDFFCFFAVFFRFISRQRRGDTVRETPVAKPRFLHPLPVAGYFQGWGVQIPWNEEEWGRGMHHRYLAPGGRALPDTMSVRKHALAHRGKHRPGGAQKFGYAIKFMAKQACRCKHP